MSSSSSSGLPPASLAMAPPPPASASSSPQPPAPATAPAPVSAQAPEPDQEQPQPQPSVAEPSAAAAAAAALPDPASTALPPPPVHPLPPHLGLPGKLEHIDSASSVVAEPPTPLPSAPLAAAGATEPVTAGASTPVTNGVNGANGHAAAGPGRLEGLADESSESYNVEAERAVEHDHVHPGLGMYHSTAPAAPGEHSSAVDVLADVAMGEAALGLADFASGAGSGDVKEGSPAVPADAAAAAADSPSLKRAAPDEAADYVSAGGAADGTGEAGQDREAKRLKVEPDVRSRVFRLNVRLLCVLIRPSYAHDDDVVP